MVCCIHVVPIRLAHCSWIDQRKTSCPICRRDMDSDDSNKPPPPPPNQPCQVHQQEWEQDFPQAVLLEAAARSSARPVLHLNNVNTSKCLIRVAGGLWKHWSSRRCTQA